MMTCHHHNHHDHNVDNHQYCQYTTNITFTPFMSSTPCSGPPYPWYSSRIYVCFIASTIAAQIFWCKPSKMLLKIKATKSVERRRTVFFPCSRRTFPECVDTPPAATHGNALLACLWGIPWLVLFLATCDSWYWAADWGGNEWSGGGFMASSTSVSLSEGLDGTKDKAPVYHCLYFDSLKQALQASSAFAKPVCDTLNFL